MIYYITNTDKLISNSLITLPRSFYLHINNFKSANNLYAFN